MRIPFFYCAVSLRGTAGLEALNPRSAERNRADISRDSAQHDEGREELAVSFYH